ncbi:MAG TPA: hypothetical protein VGG10_03255 [Rhizomicrobium sp.]|jgi:hypothetical protein
MTKAAFFAPGNLKDDSRTGTSRLRSLWRACIRSLPTYTLLEEAGALQFRGTGLDVGEVSAVQAALAEFAPDVAIIADAEPTEHWFEFAKTAQRRVFVPLGSVEALKDPAHLDGFTEVWVRTPADAAALGHLPLTVQVLPDAFELPPLKRNPAPNTVAILNEAPDEASLALLAAMIDASARGGQRTIFFAPPQAYYALSQEGVDQRYLVRVSSLEDGLAKAQGAVGDGSATSRHAVIWAHHLGVPILVLGAADKDELPGIEICADGETAARVLPSLLTAPPADDSQTAARAIANDQRALEAALATALGLPVEEDLEATGRAIAENLALEVKIDSSYFNAWSRVLEVNLNVHGCALFDDYIEGTFSWEKDVSLPNAWVERIARATIGGQSVLPLKAVAVLPKDVEPQDLTSVVWIFGIPFAAVQTPEDVPAQTAGLIGLEIGQHNAVQVEFWAADPQCPIQLGRKTQTPASRYEAEGRPHLLTGTGKWPFDRETLTTLPTEGVGQRFRTFQSLMPDKRQSSARLEAMKDAYAGRTAWLIGNGPSVAVPDLEKLKGALTFCFNRFYLAYPTMTFRPTFTVTGDEQMIEDFGQEIIDLSGGQVFVASWSPPPLTGDYCWVRQVAGFPSLFSKDATRRVSPGGSSLYVAMQIAYYLGIRNFYIYGADFKFSFTPVAGATGFRTASGDGNHFIKNYRSGKPWCPPALQNILSSFLSARMLMEADGGFIRNATRGGELEVFDRMDFDDAVADTREREAEAAAAAVAAQEAGLAETAENGETEVIEVAEQEPGEAAETGEIEGIEVAQQDGETEGAKPGEENDAVEVDEIAAVP